eukprot:4711458-Pleurochrysis_carterae.AAC.1
MQRHRGSVRVGRVRSPLHEGESSAEVRHPRGERLERRIRNLQDAAATIPASTAALGLAWVCSHVGTYQIQCYILKDTGAATWLDRVLDQAVLRADVGTGTSTVRRPAVPCTHLRPHARNGICEE